MLLWRSTDCSWWQSSAQDPRQTWATKFTVSGRLYSEFGQPFLTFFLVQSYNYIIQGQWDTRLIPYCRTCHSRRDFLRCFCQGSDCCLVAGPPDLSLTHSLLSTPCISFVLLVNSLPYFSQIQFSQIGLGVLRPLLRHSYQHKGLSSPFTCYFLACQMKLVWVTAWTFDLTAVAARVFAVTDSPLTRTLRNSTLSTCTIFPLFVDNCSFPQLVSNPLSSN